VGPDDDKDKRYEASEHVGDGEDTIDRDRRIKVGEIINGGDEGVPREEEASAECEVDEVTDVEVVMRGF
jgi:hypothetical protein